MGDSKTLLRQGGASKFVSLTDTPRTIPPGRELIGDAAGEALLFIRKATSQGGLEVVHTVPTDNIGAVLYLKHSAITQSGNTLDRRITPGFAAPDFYGYSDGTSYPATGLLTGAPVPLAWIGSDRGTRSGNTANVTQWDLDYIASPSRSWLHGFKGGWIGGRGFNLSDSEVFEGGVWLKPIIGFGGFPNGTLKTFQLKKSDDSTYFKAETTVHLPAGILWWDKTRYVLLGEDTLRYKGLHAPAAAYIPGDLVASASGRAYVCIADAPANTALTDKTKWVTLTRTSIVDVTGQGGHPQIVEENKDQLHADFSLPRIWLPQHIPLAVTPATGTSALWPIHSKYSGTHDYFPPNTPIGNIGYSRAQHIWQRKDSASARATLTLVDATADKAFFPGKFVWLGERLDANAAAAQVPGNPAALDATTVTTYLYYNETSLVVERLLGYTQSASPGLRYEAMRLLTVNDKSVKPTSGSPRVTALNQFDINVDPTVPRAWIGQRIPFAGTPAVGTSAQFPIADPFIGSFDTHPPTAKLGPEKNDFGVFANGSLAGNVATARTARTEYEGNNPSWLSKYNANRFLYVTLNWTDTGTTHVLNNRRNAAGNAWETFPASYVIEIGQTYYNKWLHYWAIFYDGIDPTGIWTHTSYLAAFRSYAGTTYWLGRRSSAIDAAAHVAQPKDTAGRYVFYNTSTYQVEQLSTDSIIAGVDARTDFHPIPLLSEADKPEVLVDTLASTAADVAVDMSTTAWTRRISSAIGTDEKNQIAFNRQLYPGDDHRLMSVELTWEEVQVGQTSGGVNRHFMATISAGGFRRFVERTYMATGSNKGTLNGCADWYVRRPRYSGASMDLFAEMRISYGRFRAAYKSNGLGDDSAAARATAPDGMAFQFGAGAVNPNTTAIQKLKARIELH